MAEGGRPLVISDATLLVVGGHAAAAAETFVLGAGAPSASAFAGALVQHREDLAANLAYNIADTQAQVDIPFEFADRSASLV